MQCSEWAEWMSLRLDSLLGQEQAEQLQIHLARCPFCREQWEAMSWISSMLKAEPVAVPTSDFTSKVIARVRQSQVRRRRIYSSLGVCLGSVGLWGAVAAILLGALLLHPALGVVLREIGLPLLENLLSMLMVLGKALWYTGYALVTRPAGLLILAYAVLAGGLTLGWMRVLLRRWERVL